MLTVPSSPDFEDYSDVAFQDDSGEPVIWHIAITGYVVAALLRLLAAARDSAVGVACVISQMGGNDRDMLVPCHLAFAAKLIISAFSSLSLAAISSLSPAKSPMVGHTRGIGNGSIQLIGGISTSFLCSQFTTFHNGD